MSQQSMDDFFKMVGFDPSSETSGTGDAAGAAEAQYTSANEGTYESPERGAASSGAASSRAQRKAAKREERKSRRQRAYTPDGAASASGPDLKDAFSSMFGSGGHGGSAFSGSPFGGFGGAGHSSGGSGSGGSGKPHFVWENNPFAGRSKKNIAIILVVLILVILAAYWWFHPPLNIHSEQFWSWLVIIVIIPSFVAFRTLSWRAGKKSSTGGTSSASGKAKAFRYASYVPAALALIGVVGALAGLSIWPGNAARYSNILQVEDCDFSTDIQEADYDSIPVIDRSSAIILGNRTLGEIPDYVSQFEISSVYSQINYQGRPVRVSPLNYADIFKWITNLRTGVPAYVLVDMASQDTSIVRLDEAMHYVESDPLFYNIDRYVQLKYPTYYFEEKAFEADEDGTPWWVCPVQTRTIGLFGGETIERVVLVNACTGECQDYAIEDCPQWVDRAYPSQLLIQQYNWRGALSGGWLNSIIGQRGVVQTTPGTDGEPGYNYIAKDDDVWVYTGVTSATSDNAIVGFVLVNQRTQEAHFYSVAGATEESAMASAEGQVQNLKYEATFPLLLNVDGQPTYFMALKDSAGLAKKFAMLDIQRYQNVAVGDTVSGTQKSYEALLVTNGALTEQELSGSSSVKTASGVITRMTEAVVDGNSHFYLVLSDDDHIYDCALPAQLAVVAYQVGDQISLNYIEGSPTSAVQSIEGEEVVQTTDQGDSGGTASSTASASGDGSTGK